MTAAPAPALAPSTLGEHGGQVPARPSRVPSATGAVFAQVLRETDRGLTADRIAAALGVPDEVVLLALEHAERIGLVVRAAGGSLCSTGCPTGPDKPLGCYGCPFSR